MSNFSYNLSMSTPTENPRICFDVDGVIADHRITDQIYKDREPYPGVIDKINRLKKAGYYIILQTARYMSITGGEQEESHRIGYKELSEWCEDHGLMFDEIYLGKASSTLYVDDKGFCLRSDDGDKDWEKLFELLEVPFESK